MPAMKWPVPDSRGGLRCVSGSWRRRASGRSSSTRAASSASLARRRNESRVVAQFVLVHGAWHGAWCWKRVVPLLRNAGHDVHAVTLTGLGERAHLLTRDIRLETHI